MHPVLKEGVALGTFLREGSGEICYYAENAEGDEYEISRRLFKALDAADGTRPLKLPNRGRKLIPKLKRCGLIRTSRFVREGWLNRFILFPIGSRGKALQPICNIINVMLPALALLLFAGGIILKMMVGNAAGYDLDWVVYYGLIILSVALHETGHLIAGLAYNYEIHDTGILLLGILPAGAYVAHGDNENASRKERMQFALAGVEMNLVLAGLFLILSAVCRGVSFTMTCAANVNVIMALLNLMPAYGLDGEAALSALLDVDSVFRTARKSLFSRRGRKKLFSSGLHGCAALCIFAFTMLSQLAVSSLIIFDIVYLCTLIL